MAYAKQILALAGIGDAPRLKKAFATVPRERFIGPPPWQISRPPLGYVTLPSTDPVVVYQDVLLALSPERGVNNGSPSLHAQWLHTLSPREGDRVVHIGAGTGYYTALLAHLVGESGHVLAVEYDPDLVEQAKKNLSEFPYVTVIQGDGADWPQEEADRIYVNFSVVRPADAWIGKLRSGGRLVLPLGVPRPKATARGGRHALHGAGFCFEREGERIHARWIGPAYFICAEGRLAGANDEAERLKDSFERGGVEFVRSLVRGPPAAPQRCWFVGAGWALSFDEAVG
ncbi:protein-L-isoaspartate O-methyltransferase family protein [Microvirga rosea]|uniref:protein-L-isoaspartate O-methyltransferase family protein n=1 Tax=Microvirga rosea TaxID=2715425 RepID=UPI001D0AC6F5|nr:methyltransferase domain-containing protein [Microvirga rosea]MCB8820258.1 methyltransferase domain-containing protein [Microvirga rosea]